MEIVLKAQNDILEVQKELLSIISKLDGKRAFVCEIKPYSKKRSLDSNAYFWELINKLSKAIKTSQDELYRHYIEQFGCCYIHPSKNEDKDEFMRMWGSRGKGWFCKEIGASKLKGYTNIQVFFGSSVYGTKDMSNLIDEIIEDCKEQGINTLSPAELEMLDGYKKIKGE